jgi:hypothetical protein
MPNFRWRLVRRRRPKAEDLSFPPPAREQARYIKLADEFLAHFTSEESDRVRSGEFAGQAPAAKSGRAAYARKSLHLLYLPASSKA